MWPTTGMSYVETFCLLLTLKSPSGIAGPAAGVTMFKYSCGPNITHKEHMLLKKSIFSNLVYNSEFCVAVLIEDVQHGTRGTEVLTIENAVQDFRGEA